MTEAMSSEARVAIRGVGFDSATGGFSHLRIGGKDWTKAAILAALTASRPVDGLDNQGEVERFRGQLEYFESLGDEYVHFIKMNDARAILAAIEANRPTSVDNSSK